MTVESDRNTDKSSGLRLWYLLHCDNDADANSCEDDGRDKDSDSYYCNLG